MHFLLLCIFSSTGIFIIFRFLSRERIRSFPVIVINYLLATILGLFVNSSGITLSGITGSGWLPLAALIGFLFIVMFFLVAYSTETAGISVTTVAGKMSVIFPIILSLILEKSDRLTLLKSVAILTALAGVTLTVIRPGSMKSERMAVVVPLLLFVGMGLVDSLVKFAQHRFVRDDQTALFSGVLFLFALITGMAVLAFRPALLKAFRSSRVWIWGIALGTVNFGSIYFLVRTLNYISPAGYVFDSSTVFGVNNTAIVALSVLAGYLLFTERPRPVNWSGICLSVIAIILFSAG